MRHERFPLRRGIRRKAEDDAREGVVSHFGPVVPQKHPSDRFSGHTYVSARAQAYPGRLVDRRPRSGALRRLNELGVLSELHTISWVSGGTIGAVQLGAVTARSGTLRASRIPDWDHSALRPAT